MKRRWRIFKHDRGLAACVTCALWLAGCASNPSAPVEDRSLRANGASTVRANREIPAPSAGTYHVLRGDTLYAIAFKHGVDFRDLALLNGITSPYRIFPGQELRLSAATSASADRAPRTAVTQVTPDRAVIASAPPATSQNAQVDKSAKPPATGFVDVESEPAKPPAATPTAPPVVSVVATATQPPITAPPRPAPVAPEPVPKPAESVAQLNAGGVAWRWPGNGKVVGTYVSGEQTRQGIDIAGNAGDPVQAAADGEVVYSGNGLLGYGELIIIKHNAIFLSAYGHNRKRLVQEGGKVKAGQQIAEMGSSASSREELHFEIRKNGKPVNPLDYLPVR